MGYEIDQSATWPRPETVQPEADLLETEWT